MNRIWMVTLAATVMIFSCGCSTQQDTESPDSTSESGHSQIDELQQAITQLQAEVHALRNTPDTAREQLPAPAELAPAAAPVPAPPAVPYGSQVQQGSHPGQYGSQVQQGSQPGPNGSPYFGNHPGQPPAGYTGQGGHTTTTNPGGQTVFSPPVTTHPADPYQPAPTYPNHPRVNHFPVPPGQPYWHYGYHADRGPVQDVAWIGDFGIVIDAAPWYRPRPHHPGGHKPKPKPRNWRGYRFDD